MALPVPVLHRNAVRAAIDNALTFLKTRQLAWGEFASYRFTHATLAGPGLSDSSPFVTTFVLHALDFVEHPLVDCLRQRALGFLLEQRTRGSIWHYWSSRQGTPIDPDLDDTCCASFVLRSHLDRAALLDGNVAAILNNRHDSGLFKTWLRDADADNDVDCAVNANVLLYLGERAETLAARDIVVNVINQDREAEATWYYCDPLALYYMVARAYWHGVTGFGVCRDSIVRKIGARLSRADNNVLDVALAIATLAHYGEPLSPTGDKTLRILLAGQRDNGSWPPHAFYSGPEPPGPRSVWFGSSEMTTALCIEALARSSFYR